MVNFADLKKKRKGKKKSQDYSMSAIVTEVYGYYLSGNQPPPDDVGQPTRWIGFDITS